MQVIKRYDFTPDYNNIVSAARNIWANRLPLFEYAVGQKVIYETTGNKPQELMFSNNKSESIEGFKQYWDFFKQMGYDVAPMEFSISRVLIGGGALANHKDGCIKTREDFEKYPWDEMEEVYFEQHAEHIRNFTLTCPNGMKAIGGVGNGVFETVEDLVGYIDLCYIKSDDEELYQDLFNKVGELHRKLWQRFMDEFSDVYCVMRMGDDLGFNSGPLLPPGDIRALILPKYRAVTDMVHAKGKPFLLHSCGNIFEVFDDIIKIANIDAKHSNEDIIAPFDVWVDKYGDKIGNFGGVDVDVLCHSSETEIKEYVLTLLEKIKGKGGIAFSSGNSIPDYVPTEGYLAMVNTVREWRGDKRF